MTAAKAKSPCHCLVLRRAARALTGYYDAALQPAGLTTPQYALLRGFEHLGPVSISAAARALELDRTTLGRNLRPLEQAGLLARREDGSDARERRIALTPAGRRAIARATPLWAKTQTQLEARLGHDKLARLRTLLTEVEAATA